LLYGFVPLETRVARDSRFLGLSRGCRESSFCLWKFDSFQYVFVSFGSVGYVLVPRTSSTPVATWSWPTWVVESETCVGSRVHLVGASIFFENNCSHSLPPLWFAVSVFHLVCEESRHVRLQRPLERRASSLTHQVHQDRAQAQEEGGQGEETKARSKCCCP
jgi:hypothetical protein